MLKRFILYPDIFLDKVVYTTCVSTNDVEIVLKIRRFHLIVSQ